MNLKIFLVISRTFLGFSSYLRKWLDWRCAVTMVTASITFCTGYQPSNAPLNISLEKLIFTFSVSVIYITIYFNQLKFTSNL